MVQNSYLSWITRAISLVLMLAVLLASLPQPAMAAEPAQSSCTRKHTVKSGETLSSIGDLYKVSWLSIATANDLKSPYTIYIGQVLCISGGTTSDSSGTSGTTASSKKASFSLDVEGTRLLISVSNFPKKNIYYVNLGASRKWPTAWTKIGILRTKKNTAVTRSFLLPDEVREEKTFVVCLKNVVTDDVLCKRFTQ